ncbi:MAG: DUF1844 domain-containing protein [Candidatus Omnitrophota bacterium]|nr:DUF1844 domain-containing protein [Candidatus Omnitrophota bacterium]
MQSDKDIHFPEKKVDQNWKEKVEGDKARVRPEPASAGSAPQSSQAFLSLLNSLAMQAMIHMGEIPHPESQKPEVEIDEARSVIDLLVQLKEKTRSNTGPEENTFFESVLPELQMKFVQKS